MTKRSEERYALLVEHEEDALKEFSIEIQKILNKKNISPLELGDLCGIRRSNIYRRIGGKESMSIRSMIGTAAALGYKLKFELEPIEEEDKK